MRINNLASAGMLVIGCFGFALGIYTRATVRRSELRREPVVSAYRPPATPAVQHSLPSVHVNSQPPPESLWTESQAYHQSAEQAWDSAVTRLRFTGWLVRANLDPDRRRLLEGILMDHARTIRTLGMEWAGEARHQGREQSIEELTQAVQPVLRESELTEFRRELVLEEVNRAVNNIGADLFRQGAPLTETQLKELTGVICDNRTVQDRAVPVIELDRTNWDQVILKSASFLSQPQLDALRALAARREFSMVFKGSAGYNINRHIPGL